MTDVLNSVTVEVEFTAGVWTDVTSDVDFTAGLSTKFGRKTPYSQAETATFNCMLDNTLGRYTPHRQVLADGVTAHPYYPNVVPDKRVRLSYTANGTTFRRFVGYINGWPPNMVETFRPRIPINASCLLSRLANTKMRAPILTEVMADAPALLWSMNDVAGAKLAGESSGNDGPALLTLGPEQSAMTFGSDGPGSGNGTAVTFAPSTQVNGQVLTAALKLTLGAFTVETYVKPGTALPAWGGGAILGLVFGDGTDLSVVTSSIGGGQVLVQSTSQVNGGPTILDDAYHHVAITRTTAGGPITLYVDGVAAGSTLSSNAGTAVSQILIGDASPVSDGSSGAGRYQGSVGYVGVWTSALSPARLATHAAALHDFDGELNSDRVKRILGYAGVTSTGYSVDTSTVVCGSYPQDGQDILSAIQDACTTEGGGSVFYTTPDGLARWTNRAYRKPGAPSLTVDAINDIDGANYVPAYDNAQTVSEVDGSRATASTTESTQIVTNGSAIVRTDSFTSYAKSDLDVLNNAQARLAEQSTPAFRLDSVSVDVFTATAAGIYAAVAGCLIGSRIHVTGLYAAAAPATQLDVVAEGFADTIDDKSYVVTFDTSPADNPARAVYDDPTYGRYQANADCALNASATAAATTVVIKTPTGPHFTTTTSAYPLRVKVGEEVIKLNNPPTGGTSPQTFNGVTRGDMGTPPAQQAANAPVRVWPAATYTL